MGQVYAFEQELESFTCWAREGCGVHFAMPKKFVQVCREQGTTFYCPKGHALRIGESEVEELKKSLQNVQKRLEWAEQSATKAREREDAANRSRDAYKGQLTRVKNGVCPCCRRSFQNIKKHMATKHPGYMETEK